jgi:hypothetical protein
MAVNNIRAGRGTALDFGIRATTVPETSGFDGSELKAKNPPSADSPVWMPPVPVQTSFNQAHANAAKAIHDCAQQFNENALPNSDTCRITQFAAAFVASPPAGGPADIATIIQLIQMPLR